MTPNQQFTIGQEIGRANAQTELLSTKELADALHRTPAFISAMKHAGYVPAVIPLNLHRLADAIAWLNAHPDFRGSAIYRRAKKSRKKTQQCRS